MLFRSNPNWTMLSIKACSLMLIVAVYLSLIHIFTKKGLNFGANSGNPVHKNLGETVSVVGTGDKADTNYSSENIKTKINADGNIEVMMDKDLKADSVTTDKVKVGKNGKDGVSITCLLYTSRCV